MSVWLCLPSARAPQETTFHLWKQMGYRIAVFRDAGAAAIPGADLSIAQCPYPGYAIATNQLVHLVMARDSECQWLVGGGDDIEPDLCHPAEEIAAQCTAHFAGTFGVMQPTGDRWADGSIDRIAGSPWMGREFCRRIYGGKGPLWVDYFHMFVDQDLQEVAQKLGIFWQRQDLIHLHNHWMRIGKGAPAFLAKANSREHWDASQQIFNKRKAGGFAEALNLLPE